MKHTKVGIIGSGMIGAHAAQLAVDAGLEVFICNSRGPDSLKDLVTKLGEKSHAVTFDDMVKEVELIVLAIPFPVYKNLPVDSLAGKILIDTLNYYPQRDGVMSEVKTDTIATTQLVQQHLSKSIVVRAMNNVDFVRLLTSARPSGADDRSALPVAGDVSEAKESVIAFLDQIGYDAVDMGNLAESWRSEPTTPVYVAPYMTPETSYVANRVTVQTFMTAPGRTVSREEVERLVKAAVRHDKMFGELPIFADA